MSVGNYAHGLLVFLSGSRDVIFWWLANKSIITRGATAVSKLGVQPLISPASDASLPRHVKRGSPEGNIILIPDRRTWVLAHFWCVFDSCVLWAENVLSFVSLNSQVCQAVQNRWKSFRNTDGQQQQPHNWLSYQQMPRTETDEIITTRKPILLHNCTSNSHYHRSDNWQNASLA